MFIKQFGRGILLLVLGFGLLFLVNNYQDSGPYSTPIATPMASNPSLVPKLTSSSTDTTNGNLSGNSYRDKDSSAITGSKVTFGFSNRVSFSAPNSNQSPITISTGNLSKNSPISPLDFGANELWYDGGYGAQNPQTEQLYGNVINQVKDIGVSILRFPGGIPSDTFHWQTAIGPQNQRSDNVVYQSKDVFFPSTFGPDEFGQLLQSTGSMGDITVNFGTGTAREAADWVQYMTASSSTNAWGKLRAKNGHAAPYDIPYWEVGNEQQPSSGENYWRSGSVVLIGNNEYHCSSSDIKLCEYVYGGTTAFSRQKAIAANNNSVGDGAANQVFFAQYPPIVPHSQSLFVNGQLWYRVSNIAKASAHERVYQIDDSTGKIVFGNGAQGASVPAKATVTISYQSGPHDGFMQFYKLMKSADPEAKICSSYESVSFIQLMGSTNPYDCLVSHLYVGGIPSTNDSTVLFHNNLMEQSYHFGSIISTEQADIKRYAGDRAHNISLAVTEYGVNALTSPNNQPNYHRSQDIGLLVANTLRILINAHIPVAEKHYLISFENSRPPGIQTYINSNTFANNALISGPGPNSILEPSAYVLQAYTKLLYSNLIGSLITNNPSIIYSGGSYPALAAVATTNKKGNESLLVINMSESENITAELVSSMNTFSKLKSWTLGTNSYLAYNTPSDPSVVGFVENNSRLYKGKISATFPPGSITVMQMSK